MELPSRRADHILILSPQGRIDQAHAEDFKAALDPHLQSCQQGNNPIVLDFAGVSYISSVGLRALMIAARQIKNQGGRIVIAALTPIVQEVFDISRFNLVYPIFDTVDAAVTDLTKPS